MSLKAMRISINECKERTARMRAKREDCIKSCSSSYRENKDEDLKVIDVSPIRSLFLVLILMRIGLEMILLQGVPIIRSF